jgi:hypothetical protein
MNSQRDPLHGGASSRPMPSVLPGILVGAALGTVVGTAMLLVSLGGGSTAGGAATGAHRASASSAGATSAPAGGSAAATTTPAGTATAAGSGAAAAGTAESESEYLHRAQDRIAAAPAEALTLAEGHPTRFPDGKLGQEREMIAIRALSGLGRKPEARARARLFVTLFPESPYRKRIETLVGDLGDPAAP